MTCRPTVATSVRLLSHTYCIADLACSVSRMLWGSGLSVQKFGAAGQCMWCAPRSASLTLPARVCSRSRFHGTQGSRLGNSGQQGSACGVSHIQGYLAHKKQPPSPLYHHMTLGIVTLYGRRRGVFLMSEVPRDGSGVRGQGLRLRI